MLRAIDFPAVLSTHQSVGYQVPVPMLIEFADRFDHLIGINLSHQDLGYLSAIIDALGDRLEIHVGGPHLALTALSLGGTGYLSSEGNLAPTLCVGVINAYRENDAWRMVRALRKTAPAVGHASMPPAGYGPPRPPSMRWGCPAAFPAYPSCRCLTRASPPARHHRATGYRGYRGLGVDVARASTPPRA